jgi:hypothetical protein
MDQSIDLSTLITLGGCLVSVAGAAAAGRMQIRVIQETLTDIEARIRVMDKILDKFDAEQAVLKQRTNIIAELNAPSLLEARARETATMVSDIATLKSETAKMRALHNGVHPPVPSERKAT